MAIFFIAWQVIGESGRLYSVPPLTKTASVLWSAIINGDLYRPTIGTLEEAGLGLALALVVGVLVGVMVGLSARLAELLNPLINILYSAPIAVLIPVLGIYLGVELAGKVAIVFLFCVFAVIVNTEEGIRTVDKELIAMARCFEVRGVAQFRKILVPAVLPHILTAFRIGCGRAVQGAITAELLLNLDNLGAYLDDASHRFDIPRLVAGTFFISLLAFAAIYLARVLESRLLRWKRLGSGSNQG